MRIIACALVVVLAAAADPAAAGAGKTLPHFDNRSPAETEKLVLCRSEARARYGDFKGAKRMAKRAVQACMRRP